jgi:hypothetical protein
MLSATPSADPLRDIPANSGAREDRIEAALATLAAEERRLERIGLALPLARCRAQRRYWTFLRGVFALHEAPARPARPPVFPPQLDWGR